MSVALRREAFDIAQTLSPSRQGPMTSPLHIAIDHAAADDRHCETLCTHLGPIAAQRGISLWSALDVPPGGDVEAARAAQIDRANVVLLLVSPDYLAEVSARADFLDGLLAQQREGQLHAVPILVRSSVWNTLPLGRLKPLPTDGRAVVSHRTADEGWTEVMAGLTQLLSTLSTSSGPMKNPDPRRETPTTTPTGSPMPAPTRGALRQLLLKVAINDTDLRMLCIDHLPDLMRHFSAGMSYDAMINTVIERVEPEPLLQAIEQCDGLQSRLERYRHILTATPAR